MVKAKSSAKKYLAVSDVVSAPHLKKHTPLNLRRFGN